MVTQGPTLPPVSSIPDLRESLPPVSMLCAKFGTCVHHFFQHFFGHRSVYDASLTAEGLGEAVDLGVQRQSVTGLVNTQQAVSAPALLKHRFVCGWEHLVAPKALPRSFKVLPNLAAATTPGPRAALVGQPPSGCAPAAWAWPTLLSLYFLQRSQLP